MRITIEYSPTNPTTGTEVTFTVTAIDDATTPPMFVEGSFGAGEAGFWAGPMCIEVAERYGPWTPPDRLERTTRETYTNTYESAGTYEVMFRASTNECNVNNYDPYASEGTETIEIIVHNPSSNPLLLR